MPEFHYKYSPSGSAKWINCHKALELEAQMPEEKDSVYAAEGTAAHTLAEKCLTKKMDAADLLGTKLVEKEMEFEVTEEMSEAVQIYLDKVRSLIKPGSVYGFETQFRLNFVSPDLGGTSDCFVYNPDEKTVYVIDYKYGKGVEVFPENNSQMMIYAIGALYEIYEKYIDKVNKKFESIKNIKLIIVQPRIYGREKIKEWSLTLNELRQWSFYTLRPAVKANESEDKKFCVGSHCRWCKAAALCPAKAEAAAALAKTDFHNPVLPDIASLTAEDISKVLTASAMIASWAKQVESYAHFAMEHGKKIPGYKLVRKSTNRKWKDENEAAIQLEMMVGDVAYERKLLSIAKIEKILKAHKIDPKKCLNGMWVKPEGRTAIASESDRRPEAAPAASEFLVDEDFLK